MPLLHLLHVEANGGDRAIYRLGQSEARYTRRRAHEIRHSVLKLLEGFDFDGSRGKAVRLLDGEFSALSRGFVRVIGWF